MITVMEVVERSAAWLAGRGVETARLDAELLVADALGLERMQVYLQFDRPLQPDELAAIRERVRRRGEREPVAHITGRRAFHDIEVLVAPGLLVPRPATEALVEAALPHCAGDPVYVADVCAGTGCVGLALAHARSGVRVYATDRDPVARDCVRANARRLGLADRVAPLLGDLLEPIPPERPVDVVVANPPYVPSADIHGLQPEVARWERREALDGGPDGLDVIRRLVPAAAVRARRAVLVEVGAGQHGAVAALLEAAGLVEIRVHRDLQGIERVVEGRAGG